MGITERNDANSLKSFQEIFGAEPEVQIDALEEEPASGRGDNYTATLSRVHLFGNRKTNDGKKQRWEKYLICKRLPENMQLREAYKSDKLFRNEVTFYNSIMPELLKFQSTKTTHDKLFDAMPKCYHAQNDLLIMEDLRPRGFQMPDRKKGLSVAETEVVLKQVAHFHALSLAYKFQHPQQFDALRNSISEGIFCTANESWYKNYYECLIKNAIQMVSDILPKDSKYVIALNEFAESLSFFSRMIRFVSTETLLSAICHGDCWVNNFLYRYNYTEDVVKVLDVCLVDFQLIRYSSIALDVANILFCCTNKTTRDQHLKSFLKLYTDEVYRWLQLLCDDLPDYCATNKIFESLFDKELKTYGRFALGIAMDIIPISTCASEDAPDMYLNSSGKTLESAPRLNLPPNDLCRQKMAEIVIDMVDSGML